MEDLFLRFIVFAIAGLVIGYLSGFFGIGGGILRIPVFLDLLPIFGVAHPVLMHVAVQWITFLTVLSYSLAH